MTVKKKDEAMSNQLYPTTAVDEPMIYQIKIKGRLGSQWANWFGGLAITQDENGDTLITGPVADQAALHGLLRKVRDLGMPLISVLHIESDPLNGSQSK